MPVPNATAPPRRQRCETRHRLPAVVGVLGKIPVHVLDISLGGIGIEGPQALRVGSTHTVTICGHGEMLELSGTVRWCRMSISGSVGAECRRAYSAGMSFEGLRPEDLQSLYSFIAAELAEGVLDPELGSTTV